MDWVGIFVNSIGKDRMEIGICISPNQPEIDAFSTDKHGFNATNGTTGVRGLLAAKRAMPDVVKWIRSIGRVPCADPADNRRRRAFIKPMSDLGIKNY